MTEIPQHILDRAKAIQDRGPSDLTEEDIAVVAIADGVPFRVIYETAPCHVMWDEDGQLVVVRLDTSKGARVGWRVRGDSR